MRVCRALLLMGVTVPTTVLAADVPLLRPGKWEVMAQLDFGAKPIPADFPFAEPIKEITCLTRQEVEQFKGFLPPPEDGCEVRNYKSNGREVTYLVQCEEMTADLKAIVHSPDSYSGTSTSHGKDPNEKLVMKFSGKRIGEACSAKELAEDDAE